MYINIDTDNLNSLTIKVESVDSETIDLFTKSESTNSYINILDNETTSGNYAKMITLKQAGKFIINNTYNGNQVNNILFALNKLNYDRLHHHRKCHTGTKIYARLKELYPDYNISKHATIRYFQELKRNSIINIMVIYQLTINQEKLELI